MLEEGSHDGLLLGQQVEENEDSCKLKKVLKFYLSKNSVSNKRPFLPILY